MKKITIVALLCFFSMSAFSIGRPHNIFKTYKMVSVQVETQKSSRAPSTPDLSNVEKSKSTVLMSFSLAQKVIAIIEDIFN